MDQTKQQSYTVAEEVAHCIIHGLGVVFGIAALAILTGFSSSVADPWKIVACAILGRLLLSYIQFQQCIMQLLTLM